MSFVAHDKTDKQPTRKHIAERQRRARINHLLEQLENMILPPDKKNGTPVKLEKAEVLERTVEYVKKLKSASPDPTSTYVYGYMKCMEGISHYLKEASTPQTVLHSIQSYLIASVNRQNQTSPMPLESNNNVTAFPYNNEYSYVHIPESESDMQPLNNSTNSTNNNEQDFEMDDMDQSARTSPQHCDGNKSPVWRPW